jgi:tetratricopeptide (TPR) repeat protein
MADKSAILKEAQQYLLKGQVDKAIAEWEKLISEYPDGNTYNTIGDLYLKKADRKSAVESFHNAATFFMREGFAAKSLALYKKILNIDPANPDALFSLGELNEQKGIISDAVKYYQSAADSYSKEGNRDKQFDVYRKILSITPDNLFLRDTVASLYEKEGLIVDAAKEFLALAKYHEEKGDIDKSKMYYKRVLAVQPSNREVLLELSMLSEKAGDTGQAIEYMEKASSLFQDDSGILFKSSELFLKTGDLGRAKESLKTLIGIEPDNIRGHELLGSIYLQEGDRKKAWDEYLPVSDKMIMEGNFNNAISLLESFREIDMIETGKRLVTIHSQLGNILEAAGELISLGDLHLSKEMPKEALEYFKEASMLNPDDKSIKTKIVELEKGGKPPEEIIEDADIFLRYGLFDEAKEVLEKLKFEEPENIDIHERLRSLYLNTNDREMAITECLILAELYNRAGNMEQREWVLNEAYKIDPEDPRLLNRIAMHTAEDTIPPYSEIQTPSEDFATGTTEIPLEEEYKSPTEEQEITALPEESTETLPESDVTDMFSKFKEKMDHELSEDDSDTHYNLGIAYKEMGLVDDAIREFRISLKDKAIFIQSSSLLGLCYMERGQYALAIEVLRNAIAGITDHDDTYWSLKYTLAEAYERDGNFIESLVLYNEVSGWDSQFQNVSDRISRVKEMITRPPEEDKPKRKDRVSYL